MGGKVGINGKERLLNPHLGTKQDRYQIAKKEALQYGGKVIRMGSGSRLERALQEDFKEDGIYDYGNLNSRFYIIFPHGRPDCPTFYVGGLELSGIVENYDKGEFYMILHHNDTGYPTITLRYYSVVSDVKELIKSLYISLYEVITSRISKHIMTPSNCIVEVLDIIKNDDLGEFLIRPQMEYDPAPHVKYPDKIEAGLKALERVARGKINESYYS